MKVGVEGVEGALDFGMGLAKEDGFGVEEEIEDGVGPGVELGELGGTDDTKVVGGRAVRRGR